MELLIITDINTTNIGTVKAVKMKLSKIARINKGDK